MKRPILTNHRTHSAFPIRRSRYDGRPRSGDVRDGSIAGHSPARNRRIKAVLDCRAHMFARRGEAVTLQELSAIAGLQPRSLINAFRAVTSLSPMAYLRLLRLARVRETLLAANARTRVIDVAAEWGFWHMGHFTAAYRAVYGETPSETLRRPEPNSVSLSLSLSS